MTTTQKKPLERINKILAERINVITDDAIERLERDKSSADIRPAKKTRNVWLRWEIDPKTKTRGSLLGVHETLAGAQLAMPKEFQELASKYPADSPYVQNFLNKAITRMELSD